MALLFHDFSFAWRTMTSMTSLMRSQESITCLIFKQNVNTVSKLNSNELVPAAAKAHAGALYQCGGVLVEARHFLRPFKC